jgi:hypothetical protein
MLNSARTIRDIFILMVNHASEFLELLMHALHLFLELEVSCVNEVPPKVNTCIQLLVSPLQVVSVTSLVTESIP